MAESGANLDASTFDLDRWIDDVVRPEVTVELYPYEADYAAKVAAIEAQIPAAEKLSADDRGIDEASADQLHAQLSELRAERSRSALKVRVRQLTDDEITGALSAAKSAGAPEDEHKWWILAAACITPAFTPDQIKRLRARDRSGQDMVDQLALAVAGLQRGLPVPS